MQVVIDIDKEIYRKIKEMNMVVSARRSGRELDYILFNAVSTGIPLSDYRKMVKSLTDNPQESCKDMEEIKEIMECDADAETKCKMISYILTAKSHYFEKQEPKYCDRNICIKNEYNNIDCEECEVTKSQRQG